MRWPWRRTPPGTVWVNNKRLIELYRSALHVADLEAECRQQRARTARARAQVRIIHAQRDGALVLTDDVVANLLEKLPLTSEGRLYEAAFDALLEQAVWRERERPLLLLLDSSGDRGGRDEG